MPASQSAQLVSSTSASACDRVTARTKDLALSCDNIARPKARRKRVVVPPKMTPAQAQERLNAMTRQEHERCTAYLRHGSFKDAAKVLGCDQETVSRTWKMYSAMFGIVIESMTPQLQS